MNLLCLGQYKRFYRFGLNCLNFQKEDLKWQPQIRAWSLKHTKETNICKTRWAQSKQQSSQSAGHSLPQTSQLNALIPTQVYADKNCEHNPRANRPDQYMEQIAPWFVSDMETQSDVDTITENRN